MIVTSRSDVGRVRSRQEDAYLLGDYFLCVSDGMGGELRGDVASATAIKEFENFTKNNYVGNVQLAVDCFKACDLAVHSILKGRGGATMVAGFYHANTPSGDNLMTVVNTGDSRCYLIRNGKITLITEDHGYQNYLNSFIGIGPGPALMIDSFVIKQEPGDMFVFCSDGLSDFLDIDRIKSCYDKEDPADYLVDQVLNYTKAADNITVVTCKF